MSERAVQLIVGLGNPGPEYERTPHNIGFRCLERLAADHGLAFGMVRDGCRWAEGTVAGVPVVLVQPLRYMNRSGEALTAWFRRHGPETPEGEDTLPPPLVVVDDIALPLGALRLRAKGSDGGHRGLESMDRALGDVEYPRLRLGVAPDADGVHAADWADFVLEPFDDDDWDTSEDLVGYACEAVEAFLAHGVDWTASRFNRRPSTPETGGDEGDLHKPGE